MRGGEGLTAGASTFGRKSRMKAAMTARPRLALLIALVLAACGRNPEGGAERKAAEAPAAIAPVATEAPAGRYLLDRSHSTLLFRADHLGFTRYVGLFRRFDATLDLDPASPEKSRIAATIDLSSLAIPEPPAGFLETLLGPDWLNAGAFPLAEFQSRAVTLLAPDRALVAGELTLNGRSAPVEMTVDFNGGYRGFPPYDPNARIGFSAEGVLSRSAFGIAQGLPPAGSTIGVVDAVSFVIEAEFTGPPIATATEDGG